MLRQRAARGAGHLFLGNTLSQIVQGVGIILVARLLGATDYGLYTLALVPSATFFVFTRIGFGAAATRYVAYYHALGRRDEADRFATSTLLYVAVFYLLISIGAAAAAPLYASEILHEPALGGLAALATITIFFQGIMYYTTAALSGYYLTKQVSAVMLIQATSKTVLSIAFILLGLHVFGAILGTILGFVFAGTAGALWLLLAAKTRHFRFDAKTFRSAATFGVPLYVANVLNGLSLQLQLVILASIASAAAVGAFTATQNLASLVGIVTYPVTTMAGVAFSEVGAQNSKSRVASTYVSATKIATLLVVPAAVFLVFAAKPLVRVLYGSAYGGYYLLLAIFAAGYLSVGVGGQTQGPLFSSLSNTRPNAYVAAIWSALLLSLSVVFGLSLGVFGVALATAISSFAAALLAHMLFVRGLGVELPAGRLGLAYAAAFLAAAPMLLVPQAAFSHGLLGLCELLALLGAYTLLYSTLLPLLRGVDGGELSLISQSLSGVPLLGEILRGLTRYAALFVREKQRPEDAK